MEENPSQNNEDINFGMVLLAEAFSAIPEKIDEKLAPIKTEVKELETKIDAIKLKHGVDGKDGKDGKNGKNGSNGADGTDGKDGKDGQDGLDGSPDTPQDIVKKLNTLEDMLDWKVLKDFKSLVNQDTLTKAIQTLENQTRFLIQKVASQGSGGLTFVSHDATLTGDGTPGNPLSVVTTTSGVNSINGDSTGAQTLTTGTTGTDFAIVDDGVGDHKFNLPDASVTARGVVNTTTQTFAGDKTFNGNLTAGSNLTLSQNSSGISGTNADLNVHSSTNIRLVNAGLVSLASINITGVVTGHQVWLHNDTSNSITIVNNYGSSPVNSRPIITSLGSNILIPTQGSIVLEYDSTDSAWRLVGNVGFASATVPGYLSSTDWSTFNNKQATISVTSPITLSGASVGIVNQGTTTTVLHGNAAGNASFGAVSLTADVSGVLPADNGGTDAWVDYSATTTVTGFSGTPTVSVWYQKCYKRVNVAVNIAGTSNSTAFSFTLPIANWSVGSTRQGGTYGANNSAGLTTTPVFNVVAGSTTFNLYRDANLTTWTAANGKQVILSSWYPTD